MCKSKDKQHNGQKIPKGFVLFVGVLMNVFMLFVLFVGMLMNVFMLFVLFVGVFMNFFFLFVLHS
jgi:hypothetical protein